MPAERIGRVFLVYRGGGDSPGDIGMSVVELAGDDGFALFEARTGFAGRVNFERQSFWQERACVYWVPARERRPALAAAPGRWRGEASGGPIGASSGRARGLRGRLGTRRAADLGRAQAEPGRAQPSVRLRRELARRGLTAQSAQAARAFVRAAARTPCEPARTRVGRATFGRKADFAKHGRTAQRAGVRSECCSSSRSRRAVIAR